MAHVSPKIVRAHEALKAGRKQEARAILQELVQTDPDDYRVWLLLSVVTPSARASLDYVIRAEELNPDEPTITRARAWAEQRLAAEGREERPAKPVPTAPAESAATTSRRRLRPFLVGATIVILLLLTGAFLWSQQVLIPQSEAAPEAIANESKDARTRVPTRSAGHFLPVAASKKENATPTPADSQEGQIAAKEIVASGEGTVRPRWTVTPSPTPTPTATPTVAPTFVSSNIEPQPVVLRPAGVGPDERWIDVNLSTQKLVAYEGNVPVYESLVSSGTWNHPTVTGQFRIWLRFRAQTMDGRRLGYDYYLEDVPYVMYFYRDYALHGTFWHNNFGTPMSHGCVNLPTPSAEWIFNWSAIGTLVNVHY